MGGWLSSHPLFVVAVNGFGVYVSRTTLLRRYPSLLLLLVGPSLTASISSLFGNDSERSQLSLLRKFTSPIATIVLETYTHKPLWCLACCPGCRLLDSIIPCLLQIEYGLS